MPACVQVRDRQAPQATEPATGACRGRTDTGNRFPRECWPSAGRPIPRDPEVCLLSVVVAPKLVPSNAIGR